MANIIENDHYESSLASIGVQEVVTNIHTNQELYSDRGGQMGKILKSQILIEAYKIAVAPYGLIDCFMRSDILEKVIETRCADHLGDYFKINWGGIGNRFR